MKKFGINMQFIMFLLFIIFLIISIFVKGLDILLYIIMSLLLFLMSYNNYKIYKRKYMSPIYLIFGIIVLVKVIMECING